jgi:hypothetical protein
MRKPRILKSIGGVVLPSMVLLSGCPDACAPAAAPAPLAAGVQFSATFESAGDFYSRFVTDVGNYVDGSLTRVGDALGRVDTPAAWSGDHDDACNGPETARTIDARQLDRYFWFCAPGGDPSKGHVMSAVNTTGYAILSFSPNQTFNNVHQVCWDQNLTDEGGGKWTNMVIVPESLYQRFAPRMDYVATGFNADNGPGDFNIQAGDHPGTSVWGVKVFRGTLELYQGDDMFWSNGNSAVVTADKAARFTHCVSQTAPGQVTLTQEQPDGGTATYVAPGNIPAGPVRVVFQDDNYNPPKRDGYNPDNVTWHWDNILVS